MAYFERAAGCGLRARLSRSAPAGGESRRSGTRACRRLNPPAIPASVCLRLRFGVLSRKLMLWMRARSFKKMGITFGNVLSYNALLDMCALAANQHTSTFGARGRRP